MVRPEQVVEGEFWGEDPQLVALLGEPGATGFRAVFDAFPEAVGVLWALRDAEGEVADFSFGYGNPAILRGFRLPPATRDRYTLLEALPQMRGSRAFRAYVGVCDSGEPWVQEVTYDTPFGDGYMLGTFVQRIARLGDGLVVFLTDVTEQQRMEADLRSYADVVAHDLREPVAGMAVLVSLLERRAAEPPPPDVLKSLRAGTERARELIDGVLVYARVGELEMETVALDRLMAEVAEDLRPVLEEAEATLEVFRAEAPPQVEISAFRGAREWVVTVRDNGVGIDPVEASRIFGMFSRLDPGVEGLGIGLAVSRRVVEAHGGHIWMEAAEGGGSAFRFTLPR